MIRYIVFLLFLLTSCQVIEEYKQASYPGDYFSGTIAYAKCIQTAQNSFSFKLPQGIVELHLNKQSSYIVDKRNSAEKTVAVSVLHHGDRIDNSLRYLIREGMNFSQLKQLLGPAGVKWGGAYTSMMVWRMADGRFLALMPSALEMPAGMNSYNILDENQKLQKVVKLIPLGQTEVSR